MFSRNLFCSLAAVSWVAAVLNPPAGLACMAVSLAMASRARRRECGDPAETTYKVVTYHGCSTGWRAAGAGLSLDRATRRARAVARIRAGHPVRILAADGSRVV